MGNSITGGRLKKNVHLVMFRLTVDILTYDNSLLVLIRG